MTRRKTIIGLCMLCALVFSAFAAQGASAATKGTTAFTCVSGQGTLRGEHCLTTGTASATFGHVAIAENTTTELEFTNAKTAAETTSASATVTKGTVGGLALIVTAGKVSRGPGAAWIENKKTAGGEHYLHGELQIHYTEVTANHGCKVYGGAGKTLAGTILTKQLTITTEGQGDFLKFQPAPAQGGVIKIFFLSECDPGFAFLEKEWVVTGSVKGVPTGATVKFLHAEVTAQGTLLWPTVVGLEGSLTFSGRAKGSSGAYTPLSATTVETP
jgi:hypothetical protein